MKTYAICARCSCLCDDIILDVVDSQITQAQHACSLGAAWFTQPIAQTALSAQIDGKPASLDQAMAEAARILRSARAPLIYGIAAHSTEVQQRALALADALGAFIDSEGSPYTELAFEQYGVSTTTLGEVHKRADLVLCLGADPASTHPRFFERYAPQSNLNRIVVDVQRTATADLAASFIELPAIEILNWLTALRMLVKGKPLVSLQDRFTPQVLTDLQTLAEQIKGSRYSLVLLGSHYQTSANRQFVAEALIQLVADLNQFNRCMILPLQDHHPSTGIVNHIGAANVLAWQTGYAQAVSFNRGYPMSNVGEFSAAQLLERGEVDAALWLSDAGLPALSLSPGALAHWQRIPKIVLGSAAIIELPQQRVVLPAAQPGLQIGGTAYRLDGISLPMRAILPAANLSAERLLADLYQHICSQPALI